MLTLLFNRLASSSAKTFVLKDTVASSSGAGSLQDGGTVTVDDSQVGSDWDQSSPADGRIIYGTTNISLTSTYLTEPSGAPITNATDCFRTELAYTGTFAAGTWALSLKVRFLVQDFDTGSVAWRLWRSTSPSGVSAVEITSGIRRIGISSSSALQQIQDSLALSSFSLNAEYLFLQLAFSEDGNGGSVGSAFWDLYTDASLAYLTTPVFSTGAGPSSFFQSVAGTLTPAGVLLNQTNKVLAAVLNSSGSLVKQANKVLSGILTSSASLVKQTNKVLAGTLASTGTLVKQAQKVLSGALTSSGLIVKRAQKVLSGVLTSSGIVVATKVALLSLVGTLTSSGTLVKQTSKLLSGTLTSSGTTVKQILKTFSGILTSSGSLIKQTNKVLAGTLTSSGIAVVVKLAKVVLTGTLTSAGTLVKQTNKVLSGTLTSSGTLLKQTLKVLVAALTSSGALVKRTSHFFAGTLTSSGILATTKAVLKALTGTLTSSGTLVKQTQKNLSGILTDSGALARQVSTSLIGVLTTSGSVAKKISTSLQGALSFIGTFVGFTTILFPPVVRVIIKGKQALFSLFGIKSGVTLTGKQALISLAGSQYGAILTGNQGAVTIMAQKVDIPDLPLGDDFIVSLILTNPNGTPFDLTGGGIVTFAMKLHAFDTPYIIQKTSVGGAGITITNAAGGLANLILDAVDSVALAPGTYDYSVKAVSGSGKKNTQIIGKMIWIDHASKAV